MVAHRGFEPLIFALRGRCPGPLDECAPPFEDSKRLPDRTRRRLPRAALLLAAPFLLLFAACSDGADEVAAPPAETPSPTATVPADASPDPSPGTSPSPTVPPLDPGIRTVLEQVAQERGLEPPQRLSASFLPRAELPALLDRLLTADDRAWFARTTTLYRLLGFFANDQDYLSIYQAFGSEGVLGLYSPVDDALWVVLEAGESPGLDKLSRGARETLAHELVHALQDFHFQLDRVSKQYQDDLDRSLALTAAIEGDAVTHEQLWGRKYLAIPAGGGPLRLLADAAALQTAPPAIQRELFFPYTTGAQWIAGVRSAGGTAAIDALLREPPRIGTAAVLHPRADFAPVSVTLGDISAALGEGWQRESGGTLGEFVLRNYLYDSTGAGTAAAAAEGWRGDQYIVAVNGQRTVVAARIAFASPAEARQFFDAQARHLRASDTASRRDGAIVGTADDGDVTLARIDGEFVTFAIGTDEAAALAAFRALP